MTDAPAFVVLTGAGATLARRLAAALPGAEVHGRAGRVDDADICFDDTVAHLQALFRAGRPIVGLCAAGILIRALAPLLDDKRREPPVLAVAEDGGAVVPLLGGHHGGNRLARTLAAALDIAPALTTAGDARFGVALDDPPPGWRLGNPRDAKPFMAALLAGETVKLAGEATWLATADLPLADDGGLELLVTDAHAVGSERRLVYHPATLAVGVGAERGVDAAEVIDLIRASLREAGLAEHSVAALVSLDLKADEAALHAAAETSGVPLRFFDAARLEQETPRLTAPSEVVFRAVGCHGVAEAAALAAAGADGVLVVAKRKSARATCAVARAPTPLDAATFGRPQGRLSLVGLGPGTPAWRCPEADAILAVADDVVGFEGYLALLDDRVDAVRHAFGLGQERDRVAHALALAAEGRAVALVCSGDAGIYAMASLAYELLDQTDEPAWARVAVDVVPGITAMQAAAARVGAPLGHDFCAISLSDLMTPWPAIERRIEAAAVGDFVVSFYNPVSLRRRTQLPRAREILLRHRPPTTPVVLARNLGRTDENVRVTDLQSLDVDDVDMLTVVLVGASTTVAMPRGDGRTAVYTPRGYETGNLTKPGVKSA